MIAVSEVKQKVLDYWEQNPTNATAKKTAFITALRETGIVRRACERAEIDRPTVYLWRQSDPEFKAAWEDALEDATDEVEHSLYDQAVSRRNVAATIFYLKNNREKYREETRIIISKDDMDHVIEHAIAEHQLPALGPVTDSIGTITIDASGSNTSQSSSPDQHVLDAPTPTSE